MFSHMNNFPDLQADQGLFFCADGHIPPPPVKFNSAIEVRFMLQPDHSSGISPRPVNASS